MQLPCVFAENCDIETRTTKQDISAFLAEMETINQETQQTLHQELREARVKAAQEQIKSLKSSKTFFEYIDSIVIENSRPIDDEKLSEFFINCVEQNEIKYINHLMNKLKETGRLKDFIDYRNQGMLPLHYAAMHGRTDLAKFLIDTGADPNAEVSDINNYGATPLHFAASKNNPEMIAVLVKGGAGINAEPPHGKIPLHWATMIARPESMVALIAAGADPNVKDRNEKTPLQYAVESRSPFGNIPEMIAVLIAAGADQTVLDEHGNTPLHIFIKKEGPRAMADLIAAGANPNVLDKNGNTALPKGEIKDIIEDVFKEAIINNDIKTIGNILKNHDYLKNEIIGRGDRTFLSYALSKDKSEAAAYMIKEGFKPQSTLGDLINYMAALDLEKTPDEIAKNIGGKVLEEYQKFKPTDQAKEKVNKLPHHLNVIKQIQQTQGNIVVPSIKKPRELTRS